MLKSRAAEELQTALNAIIRDRNETGFAQAFSLRHEFPTQWHRFLIPISNAGDNSVTFPISKDTFPFLFQGRSITNGKGILFIKIKSEFEETDKDSTLKMALAAGDTAPTSDNHQGDDLFELAAWNGMLSGEKEFNQEPGNWTLNAWLANGGDPKRLDPRAIEEMLIVLQYSIS